jgi:hypothetical protein
MKKLAIILISAFAIVVLIFACNKEVDKTIKPSKSIDDSQLNSLVLNFIEQFDAHKMGLNLKSEGHMPIDSARWYIQSSMNYMYSFAGTPYFNIHSDSVFVDLHLISRDETQTCYVLEALDESVEQVANEYNAFEKEKKWLIGIIVQDVGPSSQLGYEKLRVIAIIGYDEYNPYDGFDEDEKWLYGDLDGTCEGIGDVGASDILESLLNPHYIFCCVYWWDNFVPIQFYPTSYPLNSGSNYLGYQLFYANSGFPGGIDQNTICLDYNPANEIHEMQFYLDQGQDLINDALQQNSGKLLFTVEINSFENYDENYEVADIGHRMNIVIANRYPRLPGPYPIEIHIDDK